MYVHEEVVMSLVVCATIVGVDSFLRRVDRQHEVVANFTPGRDDGGVPGANVGDVRDAIPACK